MPYLVFTFGCRREARTFFIQRFVDQFNQMLVIQFDQSDENLRLARLATCYDFSTTHLFDRVGKDLV